MKYLKLFDITQIANINQYYAHTKNRQTKKELLPEHLDKTVYYFQILCRERHLEKVLEREADYFFGDDVESKEVWRELYVNAIYLHDIGKINVNFQKVKMENTLKYVAKNKMHTDHSMLSAIIYYTHYYPQLQQIKDRDVKNKLMVFLLLNSYVISKHHSHLDSIEEFIEKFSTSFEFYEENKLVFGYDIAFDDVMKPSYNIINILSKLMEQYNHQFYMYTRLLYSCLCTADYYATSDFMSGKPVDDLGTIREVHKYWKSYQRSEIYQSILRYKEEHYPHSQLECCTNINSLRSEMFLEASEQLEKNPHAPIYYLEAPTGGGKTNISIQLALQLVHQQPELNKIMYVFPFNTLVEQTYKSLLKHFPEPTDIAILNSITPFKVKKDVDEEQGIDFERTLLDRQFLHYPIVLTSHVNFFSYLFGTHKESVFALAHLANSVIILDEIQSYRNIIWKEMVMFLKSYAEVLNIKIVMMSATLPLLGELVDAELPTLLPRKNEFFQHTLFKNRVQFDFSLLQETIISIDVLSQEVVQVMQQSGGKIVIEFITKASAIKFHKKIKELLKDMLPQYPIELLTGDDHKLERERILAKITEQNNILLVTTQVFEAGVDIDMDIGFKNISILDAEEQFAGRINRSCKKTSGKVIFFKLDEISAVYKKDLRVNRLHDFSVKNPIYQQMLLEKDFSTFYQTVFKRIDQSLQRQNGDNLEEFIQISLNTLDFKKIDERMQLIEEKAYEVIVFMNMTVVSDGQTISGADIWEKYKDLVQNNHLSFAEKKVRLSELYEKMDYFIYRIHKVIDYTEIVGNILYIKNSKDYFVDGKFDREALEGHHFL